ncbi:class I SAM-dependent methyltransferase [uncultured Shewanella sp.]|uniref:class I SAM-dependent methyltransferase n=1 Tax=uncultured Shewanella sp. TaxID=173975 RepID=UPI002612359E|nr:class I SAM-dependent methyltransferase [uncultured Shewanella sp.]
MKIPVYRRPNKPATMEITKRVKVAPLAQLATASVITVDKFTECHVTPEHVALNMISYFNDIGRVLEPQCGTGQLIHALIESGCEPDSITGVERHCALFEATQARFEGQGVNLVRDCFFEFAEKTPQRFDNILMNPPFKLYKRHLNAAVSLLTGQGEIVALVPITCNLDGFYELERLPNDTFSTAIVNTKLVKYDKA